MEKTLQSFINTNLVFPYRYGDWVVFNLGDPLKLKWQILCIMDLGSGPEGGTELLERLWLIPLCFCCLCLLDMIELFGL